MINERHTTRVSSLLDDSQIKVLHGGKFDVAKKFIEPTVVRAELGAKCMQSEIFGPILPIIVLPDVCVTITYRCLTLSHHFFKSSIRSSITLMITRSLWRFTFSLGTMPSSKRLFLSNVTSRRVFLCSSLDSELDILRRCKH